MNGKIFTAIVLGLLLLVVGIYVAEGPTHQSTDTRPVNQVTGIVAGEEGSRTETVAEEENQATVSGGTTLRATGTLQ